MNKLTFTVLLTIAFSNAFGQVAEVKKDSSNFYFVNSKNKWDEESMVLKKKGDFAILRIRYWKGDCCGGVPEAEQITARFINDTVFYNLNSKEIPNCDSNIGLCGNAIDIIINTKKYPNYQNLILKQVVSNNQETN